jgi:Mg2+-importing ATPase
VVGADIFQCRRSRSAFCSRGSATGDERHDTSDLLGGENEINGTAADRRLRQRAACCVAENNCAGSGDAATGHVRCSIAIVALLQSLRGSSDVLSRRPAAPRDTATGTSAEYWARHVDALLLHLAASRSGLTGDDAQRRLLAYGRNTVATGTHGTRVSIVLAQLQSPLVLLLLFAVVASMASGEWVDSAIVLIVVVASVSLTAAREWSAHHALQILQERLHATAQVIRDGTTQTVALDTVVPGDVIVLSAGTLVAADAALLAASHCYVNEAPLTGESLPAAKEPGVIPRDTPLHRRTNCVYLGTSVHSGTGLALVVHTGARTELGRLARHVAARPPETEFERGLRHFGYLVVTAMLVMVVVVFVTHVLKGRPATETLLFSVALAVGLSPELLPAILSVNLARDAQAMASRGVLVRRLNAIENLGSMDVLCTDKTGTLTEGVVRLEQAVDASGRTDAAVLRLAAWNARLTAGIAGPLDQAIVAAAPPNDLPSKLADIPFDAARKRVSVVVAEQAGALLVTKGAFDAVVNVCRRTGGAAIDADVLRSLRHRYEAWGSQGIRVIGVATRTLERREDYTAGDEHDLEFQGFLTFVDTVKPDAADAIASLRRLGVSVVVITGDNVLVATHVARSVGLRGAVATGVAIDTLPQQALARLAERTDVFAELDPSQKERVVTALRRSGHVVGFLGDGVNDVAAMHAADTSMAVDTAVDVAQQAADFVLLERGLDIIRRGIEQGRRTFANTLKYILITMSANLGNMMSMAAASLVLPFLPLLASQVLLNNFLSDIPAIGLAGDSVDRELIEQPRRWNVTAIGRYMVRFGLLSSAFDVLTFVALLTLFRAGPALFRTAWFVESLLTELAVALVVRTRRPLHQSRPGALLLWTTIAVAAVALVLPYVPVAGLLGFVPLPAPVISAVVAITAAYVLATEIGKRRVETI